MTKNIFSVFVFLFCITFFFTVLNTYVSDNQKKKIINNRQTISKKIENNTDGLPVLINNTDDVIEFNSGFESKNNKIKRNFWNLFKKND
tara:strand:+ start:193 stop:459 length:267 start_codon:yes stop_codon:yes gene_type:complete